MEGQARRPVGRPRKQVDGPADPRDLKRVTAPNEPIKMPTWDGKMRGPGLGKLNPGGFAWHPLTLLWWKTWRRSSQAMFMMDTDWQSLFIAAVMHDRIMKGVSDTAMAALSAQLTKREGQVGAAIEDRLRLGMSPDQPNAAVQEARIKQGVDEIVDYAKKLRERVDREST